MVNQTELYMEGQNNIIVVTKLKRTQTKMIENQNAYSLNYKQDSSWKFKKFKPKIEAVIIWFIAG